MGICSTALLTSAWHAAHAACWLLWWCSAHLGVPLAMLLSLSLGQHQQQQQQAHWYLVVVAVIALVRELGMGR